MIFFDLGWNAFQKKPWFSFTVTDSDHKTFKSESKAQVVILIILEVDILYLLL